MSLLSAPKINNVDMLTSEGQIPGGRDNSVANLD